MSFLLEFNENIYDPWRIEYIAYEPIYEGLYERCDEGRWTSKDEKDFESAIRLEAGKVDMFISRKQREVESRIGYCERNLSQQKNMSDATRNSMDDALTDILADLNELGRFTRINFKALENLVEEHDKLTNTNRQPLLVEVCRTRTLDKQRFDTILVQVSSLLDICRNRLEPSAAQPTNSHFSKQSSQSARYWVHRDNITEVKAMLLFNLPIYVNDPTTEYQQTERPTSAVYFDSDHFNQYSSRLQCDDGAEIINCRWHGDNESSRIVHIERKTFVKTDQGGRSLQDEIKMDANLVEKFISQRYSAEEYANELTMKNDFDQNYVNKCYTTAHSIQKSMLDKRLEPKLRVFFNRLRFESPQDHSLSVTLDSNVAFAREDGVRGKSGEWRRQDMDINYPFKKLTPQEDLSLFPHAILETRIIDSAVPVWLSRLLDSKLVYEVPRFSTYLHGVAQFWSSQLALLPWWLSKMDEDIRIADNGYSSINNNRAFSRLSCSKSLKLLIDGQYRMGYLESQLGKKEVRHRQKSLISRSDNSIGNRKGVNINTDENHLARDQIHKKEETSLTQQIEMVSTNSLPLYGTPTTGSITSRTKLGSRASNSGSNKDSSFINTYYDGRNTQSQAYMLQDADTVGQQDELRKAAIIEIGEEKEEKKKKKKNRPPGHTIEPKQFFANERTHIHWLQFAAIILSAGLLLLNFGDRVSTVSGATFFSIAFLFIIYAFGRYRYRAYQISTQPHIRYDDLYGPIGLCTLLIGAMILNFVLRWEHPSSSTTYLGTSNQTGQQTNQNQSSF